MSLITELKRRNVIRMAGLYLVAAWLLVQVASTVLPAFEAPAWAVRTLIIVLAIGFVPALILSWVFELTPDNRVAAVAHVERGDLVAVVGDAFAGLEVHDVEPIAQAPVDDPHRAHEGCHTSDTLWHFHTMGFLPA